MGVKFNSGSCAKKSFLPELVNEVISEYFKNGRNKYANNQMRTKIFAWLALWLLSYFSFVVWRLPSLLLFVTLFFHIFCHVMIAFNIGHDALHNAIFANRRYNRILSYTMDLVGLSSFMWNINHNRLHHPYTNVHGQDNILDGYKILRFSVGDHLSGYHKYQHIYAFFFYQFSIISLFFNDFVYWKKARDKGMANYASLMEIILFKIAYIAFYVILPVHFGGYNALLFVAFYLACLMINGIIVSLVFQLGHAFRNTEYAEAVDNVIHKDWHAHIFGTCSDYASRSFAFQWFFGAVNLHVIHHLRSDICHVYYFDLSKKLRQKVTSAGFKYNNYETFHGALQSHILQLKYLGRDKTSPKT